MRPRRQIILWNPEASLLLVTRRRRLYESNYAILTEAVEITVRKDQRALAHASIAPRDLARIKTYGRENIAREAVQVITNQDGTAVVIAHVFRKPEFLRRVVSLDLDNTATGSVIRRNKHTIRAHDRCRDVRNVVGRLSILPQQLAILCVQPNC